jgi:hypothetical protein
MTAPNDLDRSTPVFVRGYSRSGGTLAVTVLDAHPQIAMSYELYPHLLETEDHQAAVRDVRAALTRGKNLERQASRIFMQPLRRYFARCARGGLTATKVLELLDDFEAADLTFETEEGRFRFMERCCLAKVQATGKAIWGLKCAGRYETYLHFWPKARFVNMLRDGRDVLASQLTTGSFNKTPEDVAKGWISTHTRFRDMVESGDMRGFELRYESLVTDPETEVRRLCKFLGVPFAPAMLQYYKHDLTIYKADHLSKDRVSQPIDNSRVGRWKKDVSLEALDRFMAVADEALKTFGYAEELSC